MNSSAYSYRFAKSLSFEYWKRADPVKHILTRRQQNMTRLNVERLQAGDRCPDFELFDHDCGRKCRFYELFRDTHTKKPFIILLFEGHCNYKIDFMDVNVNEIKNKLLDRRVGFGEYCKVIVIEYKRYKDIYCQFGIKAQSLLLIRPDQYIGLRSEPISIEALKYYLQNKLCLNHLAFEDNELITEQEHQNWGWITFLCSAIAMIPSMHILKELSKQIFYQMLGKVYLY